MKFTRHVLFILAVILSVAAGTSPLTKCFAKGSAGAFNVKEFGATGDGKTLDTRAINNAIKTASDSGGGTVYFPSGTYLTGTFELCSNVTLQLEAGAVIEGSRTLSDYKLKSDFNLKGHRSGESGEGLRAGLIVANRARNIAITGRGTIHGNGILFMDTTTPHYGDDFEKKSTRQGEDFLSPKFGISDGPVKPSMAWSDRPGALIILAECENVLVKEITIKDSPNWTVNISHCEDVEVTGINILNNPLIPNNDGINITAKNARISDCNIWTADDGIAANDCENLVVTNCILSSRSAAIRFTGGRYCTFQNLIFRETNRGIGIFGWAENVFFSDIQIQTQQFTGDWWGKAEPIYIAVNLNQNAAGDALIKNVTFSNISADAENGIMIFGTPNNVVKNITFDRIQLRIQGGRHGDAVGGNFDLRGMGAGLDSNIFKHDIPGLYCQYVDGIHIHDFELAWADSLPDYFSDGIYIEHFNDLSIDGFTGRQGQASGSCIVAKHGTTLSISSSKAAKGAHKFLSAEDVKDQRSFINNDLIDAAEPANPANYQFNVWSGNYPQPKNLRNGRHPQ